MESEDFSEFFSLSCTPVCYHIGILLEGTLRDAQNDPKLWRLHDLVKTNKILDDAAKKSADTIRKNRNTSAHAQQKKEPYKKMTVVEKLHLASKSLDNLCSLLKNPTFLQVLQLYQVPK
jgi:hypothetical protein